MTARIKRNRFDIVAYTNRGSRLQWTVRKDRLLSLSELHAALAKIVGNIESIAAADTEPGKALDVAVALESSKFPIQAQEPK